MTSFEHATAGIEQHLDVWVFPDAPVKASVLTLTNTTDAPKRLSLFGYNEWLLGPPRTGWQRSVVTGRDAPTGAVTARNPYNADVAGRVAFSCVQRAGAVDYGGPRGVHRPQRVACRPGGAADADALGQGRRRARSVRGAARRAHACPGETAAGRVPARRGRVDRRSAAELIARCGDAGTVEQATLRGSRASWDDTLGSITVQTPDDSFDVLVNRWLLYQTVSCRLWARTGYYQPGGAFGFRDQLQDVMALCFTRAPTCAASTCCAPPAASSSRATCSTGGTRRAGRGMRTRCSDDLLWLPYVAAHYVAHDRRRRGAGRDGAVPRGAGRSPPTQHEVVRAAHASRASTRHAVRALRARHRRGLTVGAHGLPLMGTGDWNDGMNRVGACRARRERLARLVPVRGAERLRPHLRARGSERSGAARYRAEARRLRRHARAGVGRRLVPPRATSTTARRSARRRTTNAGSIRSRSPGRCCRARRRRGSPSGRWTRCARTSCARRADHPAARRRPSTSRRRIPATSRATCPASARTAASTRTPRCGS